MLGNLIPLFWVTLRRFLEEISCSFPAVPCMQQGVSVQSALHKKSRVLLRGKASKRRHAAQPAERATASMIKGCRPLRGLWSSSIAFPGVPLRSPPQALCCRPLRGLLMFEFGQEALHASQPSIEIKVLRIIMRITNARIYSRMESRQQPPTAPHTCRHI